MDLWEASPVRFEDNDAHTEALIDALFPGDPLLCCGLSNSNFDTRSRSEWRGELSALQLIVPSPMTARSGLTQDGKAVLARALYHRATAVSGRRIRPGRRGRSCRASVASGTKSSTGNGCAFWIEVLAWLVLLRRATGRTFAPGHALLRFVRRRPRQHGPVRSS